MIRENNIFIFTTMKRTIFRVTLADHDGVARKVARTEQHVSQFMEWGIDATSSNEDDVITPATLLVDPQFVFREKMPSNKTIEFDYLCPT